MKIFDYKKFNLSEFEYMENIQKLVDDSNIDLINNRPWQCKKLIQNKLIIDGWEHRLKIDPNMNVSIQYRKSGVALQFQFGNVAWGFYDLVKLQTAFNRGIIESAVLVAATKDVTNLWGSNIFNYERAEKELEIHLEQSKIPLLLIGVK
jgi:hypothetical protein